MNTHVLEQSSGPSAGEIAGGVIGVLVAVILILLLIILIVVLAIKRRQLTDKQGKNSTEYMHASCKYKQNRHNTSKSTSIANLGWVYVGDSINRLLFGFQYNHTISQRSTCTLCFELYVCLVVKKHRQSNRSTHAAHTCALLTYLLHGLVKGGE